ncbi:MarR family winged helix-turn-helix transcriptional regulator [Trinickia diaoshuihuensis]|jgi:DNA-binding MarR family transcriptional regulator|uniref:MarR family winged helix-turn-helix transcriptional regulator n=1 Tax=Trinickia diaoshuihuensis TaxID=2292265 RepID=UPI000E2249E5|nr:MarR family transcriptional regulator [Trinickia diaoshuihuensis]
MTPTRPPDLSLDLIVAELMPAIGQLVRKLRSEAHSSEFNLSEASVLGRLERDGPMTTADLARAESMRPQSMKSILSILEEQGCVERKPHPTDGRQILFVLTSKGLEARRQRSMAKRDWLVEALAKLDPTELRTLAAALPIIRRLGGS